MHNDLIVDVKNGTYFYIPNLFYKNEFFNSIIPIPIFIKTIKKNIKKFKIIYHGLYSQSDILLINNHPIKSILIIAKVIGTRYSYNTNILSLYIDDTTGILLTRFNIRKFPKFKKLVDTNLIGFNVKIIGTIDSNLENFWINDLEVLPNTITLEIDHWKNTINFQNNLNKSWIIEIERDDSLQFFENENNNFNFIDNLHFESLRDNIELTSFNDNAYIRSENNIHNFDKNLFSDISLSSNQSLNVVTPSKSNSNTSKEIVNINKLPMKIFPKKKLIQFFLFCILNSKLYSISINQILQLNDILISNLNDYINYLKHIAPLSSTTNNFSYSNINLHSVISDLLIFDFNITPINELLFDISPLIDYASYCNSRIKSTIKSNLDSFILKSSKTSKLTLKIKILICIWSLNNSFVNGYIDLPKNSNSLPVVHLIYNNSN